MRTALLLGLVSFVAFAATDPDPYEAFTSPKQFTKPVKIERYLDVNAIDAGSAFIGNATITTLVAPTFTATTLKANILDAGIADFQGAVSIAGTAVVASTITSQAGTSSVVGLKVQSLDAGVADFQGNISVAGTATLTDARNLATAGTAGSGSGITVNSTSLVRHFVHKTTIDKNAMTAAATTDITLWTTPANSRLIRIVADVITPFAGGALSAVTVTCGSAAGGNQYLLSNSFFTAANVWGDAAGEVGAGLLTATWADFGAASSGTNGAITVTCRFTCTTANCNAATAGSATFYIEGVTYP